MKKKYYRVEFKGTMPSIQGITFHPNFFHGTEGEFNDIYNQLQGREDEFKILAVHSFDTLSEYEEHFPVSGAGKSIKPLTPMETFAKRELEIRSQIEMLKAKGKDFSLYQEMLDKEQFIYTVKGIFSSLRGRIS